MNLVRNGVIAFRKKSMETYLLAQLLQPPGTVTDGPKFNPPILRVGGRGGLDGKKSDDNIELDSENVENYDDCLPRSRPVIPSILTAVLVAVRADERSEATGVSRGISIR